MTDTPPSYRDDNDVSGEQGDRDFCYNTKLWTDKTAARKALGKPTGVYNGRTPYALQDKVFCINGFRESFDPDEAHRHNITQVEVEEVPPVEEHDQDGSEASDASVGEPAGDLGY